MTVIDLKKKTLSTEQTSAINHSDFQHEMVANRPTFTLTRCQPTNWPEFELGRQSSIKKVSNVCNLGGAHDDVHTAVRRNHAADTAHP